MIRKQSSLLLLIPSLAISLLGASCNQLVKLTDDSYHQKIDVKSGAEELRIVFSHNINGETHPCGCRQFPLGGLPQAAGFVHESEQKSPTIYVDTGDMLFGSSFVPETMRESSLLTAKKLAQGQEMVGLKYFTPGDQDFAMGVDFLAELSRSAKFDFVITNAAKNSPLKSLKYASLKIGNRQVYFFGLLNPELFGPEVANFLSEPAQALAQTLKELKQKDKNFKQAVLILMSHSGMAFDQKLAKQFTELDWIIGAHTQSYLREPETVGPVKIVQVLSRNHYMGEITIPFNLEKSGSYRLHPLAEGEENKRPSNPLIPWLASYKSELDQLQAKEQSQMIVAAAPEGAKLKTYVSCASCHQEQTQFWQKTSHAIAWQTLEKAQAANNPQCISCHSLGFQEAGGFATTASLVQGPGLDEKKLDQYMEEVKAVFKNKKTARELAAKERLELSQAWMKIDEKFEVEHNYANVQCLHCHTLSSEHPFELQKPARRSMAKNCLSCHTADQSPEWYHKDDNGLATTPDNQYLEAKIKELSCPSM